MKNAVAYWGNLVRDMSIDKDVVLKTAKLARLNIDANKISIYCEELSKVLDVIDTLKSADTTGVEPLVNVNEFEMLTREDIVTDGDCVDKIFKNAPKEKFGYFVVPKVVE